MSGQSFSDADFRLLSLLTPAATRSFAGGSEKPYAKDATYQRAFARDVLIPKIGPIGWCQCLKARNASIFG